MRLGVTDMEKTGDWRLKGLLILMALIAGLSACLSSGPSDSRLRFMGEIRESCDQQCAAYLEDSDGKLLSERGIEGQFLRSFVFSTSTSSGSGRSIRVRCGGQQIALIEVDPGQYRGGEIIDLGSIDCAGSAHTSVSGETK